MTATRISKIDYYLALAKTVALRATCPRLSVGAVAILDGRIISTGYNGAPSRHPHCTEIGCYLQPNGPTMSCFRAVHAEANVVANAAKHGISLNGADLYITHEPCARCEILCTQAGIKDIIWETDYQSGPTKVAK